ALDRNTYPKGLTVPDAEMEALNLRRDSFHGEWNYSLFPRRRLPDTDSFIP
ncbi:MAG: ISAzo13 family transposase, partial [Chloroflexi bacterium]|nr:ISAzo13 family transposase [Chloroflexota bacterium]MBI2764862.1 ISAzo13 family transposase [Chloroflexota bacterium]